MTESTINNPKQYNNLLNEDDKHHHSLKINNCASDNKPILKQTGSGKQIISAIPKNRQDLLKWNGWGYQDSKFIVGENRIIHFTGNRYPIGALSLPYFTEWVVETFDVNLEKCEISQPLPTVYPTPVPCPAFIEGVSKLGISYSQSGEDRLIRAHGHTLHDIYTLYRGEFKRIPDVVVWPKCHDHVVQLVRLAEEHCVVIMPIGGGTSVSGSVTCPDEEPRAIISLDTSQMNRLLWLDRENLMVCFESGIVGQDLERELKELGLTVGHEPDSYEFSSLGGWVATRASGMKKNVYGNIEDLVVKVRMVTPRGVLERSTQTPRISCGPDFDHVILGSEGTLGVITEVVLKVRPLPVCKRYGSVVFPDFSEGVKCLREVARRRCQPASIRLVDNEQFRFGQALRPVPSWVGSVVDFAKRAYITKLKGFDVTKMCVATLVFEGDEEAVKHQEKLIYEIAKKFGGLAAGHTNGERGYLLTFVIAYIRDLALEYNIVCESFETSVAWDRCETLCRNVKHRVAQECKNNGITHFLMSCRVTQTYDVGCCVYFYFGFNYRQIKDPVRVYEEIEDHAREEILASGGSISHHHGVGKLRSKWYKQTVSEVGVDLYNAAKEKLDPHNIFAAGNLIPPSKAKSKL